MAGTTYVRADAVLTAPDLAGRRFGVFGLARTGTSVLAFLRRSGATALAWDDRAEARAGVDGLVDLNTADLAGLDAIVLSPGVPLNTHSLVARARAANVQVIGDIELFARARPHLPPHRVVGVTGTNGKSTVTALIAHILGGAGVPARAAGNIGLPILGEEPLPASGVYVLELSSFQLDLTRTLACEIACMTNLTPDHLDRHGDMEGYFEAKARLFDMQAADGVAVIAVDDDWTRALAERVGARATGVSALAGKLGPNLAGPHNAQNAAVAVAACRALGIDDDAIARGLATYSGLPDRMERVASKRGVLYVNDSKATNPTSTAPALAVFPAVRWIAGGRAKTDELDACLPHLGNVRGAYLIGEAMPLFARLLSPHVPVVECGTLAAAVARAAADAASAEPTNASPAGRETVLLSPACASYDQFPDYVARGAAFRAAVEGLPG